MIPLILSIVALILCGIGLGMNIWALAFMLKWLRWDRSMNNDKGVKATDNEKETVSELQEDLRMLKREILILIVWNCVLICNIVLLTHRLNNISDCLDLMIDNFDLLLQFGEKIVLKIKQIDYPKRYL